MSVPKEPIVIERDAPLENENVYSLEVLVAYIAGYMDISFSDAKERVMKAIFEGKYPSVGNH